MAFNFFKKDNSPINPSDAKQNLNAKEGLHQELCINFAILQGEKKIINGAFIVSPTPGTSCFGEYKYPTKEISKEKTFNAGLFDGVIFDYKIVDNIAGISVKLLKVEADITSPLGIKQVIVLRAGLAMDFVETEKIDTVALGETHKFVYRTSLI